MELWVGDLASDTIIDEDQGRTLIPATRASEAALRGPGGHWSNLDPFGNPQSSYP